MCSRLTDWLEIAQIVREKGEQFRQRWDIVRNVCKEVSMQTSKSHFAFVDHYNGFEMKQSRSDWSVDV